jgi:hypothetical protein
VLRQLQQECVPCRIRIIGASAVELLLSLLADPFLIQPHAAIQVRFVLGTGGAPLEPGMHTLEGSYDVETNTPSGQVDSMKATIDHNLLQ